MACGRCSKCPRTTGSIAACIYSDAGWPSDQKLTKVAAPAHAHLPLSA